MSKSLPVALIQLAVGKDRSINLKNAAKSIFKAKQKGAKLIALPECFNSPYGVTFFEQYAETVPDGHTSKMLSTVAKENSVYILGGTFPEKENNNLYNTCTVWNPNGDLIAKYRKMHLFSIDIPGQITFRESDVLQAGNQLATFSINDIKIGIGICYDLRFEEFAKLYRLQNCNILIYPGAFNMITGPIHWELLQRSRALDNQVFVFTISPATGDKGYIAWGHSQITSPWGKVLAQAGHKEEILYYTIDISECDKVRQKLPIFLQRRSDLYNTVLLKAHK